MNCPSPSALPPKPIQFREAPVSSFVSTHGPPVYSKVVYQSQSESQRIFPPSLCTFLPFFLKFSKYLRVYRQKAHRIWQKDRAVCKEPQDNKPVQAADMRDTRKFMSKNMGRLSSNAFLSCFIAGVHESLSEEDTSNQGLIVCVCIWNNLCTVPHKSHLPLK